MAWFVPLHRDDHPCNRPGVEEFKNHRLGEMWRCEVCDDLWVLRPIQMVRVAEYTWPRRWVVAWRYRHQGYTIKQEREIGRNG